MAGTAAGMTSSPRLLLAVSGHGFGHLAQCAPVVNALWREIPGLHVTVCGVLPRDVVAGRLEHDFTLLPVDLDPVLRMHSAWEIDVPASRRVYRDFHLHWPAGLQHDRNLLETLAPDLVLADIPYRILRAAREREIPAVALCSLNWAAIYAACCAAGEADAAMVAEMRACYRSAELFLAPEPALPMPELENYRAIGPIARRGTDRRQELLQRFNLPAQTRLVLVALGGVATKLPLETWPRRPGVVWLDVHPGGSGRDDFISHAETGMAFIDLLATSDAVITKPGYGTYAEAVCNGVPILTLQRPDWPETRYLNAWARCNGRLAEISAADFAAGRFDAALDALWALAAPPPPQAGGVDQAVAWLAPYLAGARQPG